MHKFLIFSAIALILGLSVLQISITKITIDEFSQWKQQFRTLFSSHEEPFRRLIFEKNLKKILPHNMDPTQTYQKGLNQLTIYSKE